MKNGNGVKWVALKVGDTSHLSGGSQWSWEFPADLKKRVKDNKANADV